MLGQTVCMKNNVQIIRNVSKKWLGHSKLFNRRIRGRQQKRKKIIKNKVTPTRVAVYLEVDCVCEISFNNEELAQCN